MKNYLKVCFRRLKLINIEDLILTGFVSFLATIFTIVISYNIYLFLTYLITNPLILIPITLFTVTWMFIYSLFLYFW